MKGLLLRLSGLGPFEPTEQVRVYFWFGMGLVNNFLFGFCWARRHLLKDFRQTATQRYQPAEFGWLIRLFRRKDVAALRGGNPRDNAARVEGLLQNGAGDAAGTAAVLLNAAAAIYVAGLARTYEDGVARAREALGSGSARRALERLRATSTSG